MEKLHWLVNNDEGEEVGILLKKELSGKVVEAQEKQQRQKC